MGKNRPGEAWIVTIFLEKEATHDSRMVQVYRTKKQGNANWLKWENGRYNLRLDYCVIQYSLYRGKENTVKLKFVSFVK